MDITNHEIYSKGDLISSFIPKLSLVIYESAKRDHVYIEAATIKIEKINDQEFLRTGMYEPVSDKLVKLIIDKFKKVKRNTIDVNKISWQDLMPRNVIYFNNNNEIISLAWYNPAMKRLYKHDKLPGLDIAAPIIVYYYNNGVVNIYACKDEVFYPGTVLYKYPVANNSDTFCLGSAQIKDFDTYEDLMLKTESAIWDSYFTDEANEYGKITNIYEKWQELQGKGFPKNQLIRKGTVLSHIMSRRRQ